MTVTGSTDSALDRRLDPIWKASLSTRIEGVNIHDVPWYAPTAISKDAGEHFVLGLRAGLNRDTRECDSGWSRSRFFAAA